MVISQTVLIFVLLATAAAADSLPVALEQAHRALRAQEDGQAGEALKVAQAAAGTSPFLVPPGEIARFHYYTGVRAWRGGLQSHGMTAWRKMWRVGGWSPGDDGTLDDEGMAVLRALRVEGVGDDAEVDLVGERRGALILVDGTPMADGAALREGAHLVQVRCPDGWLSTEWADASGTLLVSVSCARHQVKKGARGANDAVFAAAEDAAHLATFRDYLGEAARRLAELPDPVAPRVQSANPVPRRAEEPCSGETVFAGEFGSPLHGWQGNLVVKPERGGGRVIRGGRMWLPDTEGDVSVFIEGEGAFGVRLRLDRRGEGGAVVRLERGSLDLVVLPDAVVVGRALPEGDRHEVQVDQRGTRVTVRLDGSLFLGGGVAAGGIGAVGIDAQRGAWLGRVLVCR